MFPTLKEELESYLQSGKYSELFINEFLAHVKNGTYEPDSIGKEIEYLEGKRDITATKKEAQFKGNLLKGLWHKHFFCAQHIEHNFVKLAERLLPKKINGKNKTLGMALEEIQSWVKKSVISHDKTGDWIVYKKTDRGNYYLTITKHTESDEDIYNRIKPYLTN